jgi:hypothetical protein
LISAFDPDLKLPSTYEWNLAIQRGLGANASVSATYVGAHGMNLLRTDVITSLAGYQTSVTRNADWSNYNALQLQFQRRMARGLQALASYTFAKSTDTSSDDYSGGYAPTSVSEINVAGDLGPSDFDVRNSFSAAVSWQVPSPQWERLSDALLRNWRVDGILRISSATPFDVVSGVSAPVPYRSRPDIVPGVPFYLPAPGQPGGRTLNPDAFTPPTTGPGDLPRNYFRGFPIDQTDLSVRRDFHLTERTTLSFGAEYFNLFNHPMFSPNPFNYYLGSSDFGQVTETLNENLGELNPLYQIGGPRSGQLMIKILF